MIRWSFQDKYSNLTMYNRASYVFVCGYVYNVYARKIKFRLYHGNDWVYFLNSFNITLTNAPIKDSLEFDLTDKNVICAMILYNMYFLCMYSDHNLLISPTWHTHLVTMLHTCCQFMFRTSAANGYFIVDAARGVPSTVEPSFTVTLSVISHEWLA